MTKIAMTNNVQTEFLVIYEKFMLVIFHKMINAVEDIAIDIFHDQLFFVEEENSIGISL